MIEFDIQRFVSNYNDNTVISGTSDDDNILNYGSTVTVDSGEGNDFIYNGYNSMSGYYNNYYVTINAGNGNDRIHNEKSLYLNKRRQR